MTLTKLEAAAVYQWSEAGSPGLPLPVGSAGQVRALLVFIMTANENEAVGGGELGGRISGPSLAAGPPDPGTGVVLSLQGDERLRALGSPVHLAAGCLPSRSSAACTAASLAQNGPRALCSPG